MPNYFVNDRISSRRNTDRAFNEIEQGLSARARGIKDLFNSPETGIKAPPRSFAGTNISPRGVGKQQQKDTQMQINPIQWLQGGRGSKALPKAVPPSKPLSPWERGDYKNEHMFKTTPPPTPSKAPAPAGAGPGRAAPAPAGAGPWKRALPNGVPPVAHKPGDYSGMGVSGGKATFSPPKNYNDHQKADIFKTLSDKGNGPRSGGFFTNTWNKGKKLFGFDEGGSINTSGLSRMARPPMPNTMYPAPYLNRNQPSMKLPENVLFAQGGEINDGAQHYDFGGIVNDITNTIGNVGHALSSFAPFLSFFEEGGSVNEDKLQELAQTHPKEARKIYNIIKRRNHNRMHPRARPKKEHMHQEHMNAEHQHSPEQHYDFGGVVPLQRMSPQAKSIAPRYAYAEGGHVKSKTDHFRSCFK